MPGFFSTVGTYMAGAGAKGLAAMQANPALRRTAIGAGVGGAYGMMSGDTSVLGGAMMGAGAARYGGAGFRRGMLGWRGIGVSDVRTIGFGQGFYRGVANMARADARGARMAANRGYGKIRGLF